MLMMWNISKAAEEKFQKYHLLSIPESDEEWNSYLENEEEDYRQFFRENLENVKAELLTFLPSRFVPYVENGQLNQPTLPKEVRDDYLLWRQKGDEEFRQILDAAHEQTSQTAAFLPKEVQEVFEESLHDSSIERIWRDGNTLHLYINTDGGFTRMAHIHLTFHEVQSEESDAPLEVEQCIVYYELQKIADGFAFRIILGCPEMEWTITMKGMEASYYYRPIIYIRLRDEEKLEETEFHDFINQLDKTRKYWFITPHLTCPLELFLKEGKLEQNETNTIIYFKNTKYTYHTYHPCQFIYTDIYEDPYAFFYEPVEKENIESAILGSDLTLQVRAWNTLYNNPLEHKDIINKILNILEVAEENEMTLYVYINHFHREEILTEENIKKFHAVIE